MSDIIATERPCGDCMMCCKLPAIEELDKPARKWCIHATPGVQCNIYDARPTTCRVFNCLWKIDPRIPEAFRPDKVKTVLAIYKEAVLIVYPDPGYPTAWKDGELGAFLSGWPEPFVVETAKGKMVVKNVPK